MAVDVGQFAGILFEVRPPDTDALRLAAPLRHNINVAIGAERQFILGNLVAFGQVGVEIVFAGKDVVGVDGAVEGLPDHNRVFDGPAVDDRQRPRQPQADRTDVRVRRYPEKFGATAAKHLAGGTQFDMDFHADDRLVCHATSFVIVS